MFRKSVPSIIFSIWILSDIVLPYQQGHLYLSLFNGSSIQGAYVGALYAGNVSEEPKYKNWFVDRTRSARIHTRRL